MQSCPLVALLSLAFFKISAVLSPVCFYGYRHYNYHGLLMMMVPLWPVAVWPPPSLAVVFSAGSWGRLVPLTSACFELSAARWDWTHSLIKWVAGVICLSHSFTHNPTVSFFLFFLLLKGIALSIFCTPSHSQTGPVLMLNRCLCPEIISLLVISLIWAIIIIWQHSVGTDCHCYSVTAFFSFFIYFILSSVSGGSCGRQSTRALEQREKYRQETASCSS